MNKEALISLIVPIYNVEKYLKRCVDSILNQTYKKLEIILVDDGSTDGCPRICDEYAKKDGRIKVVHKENGGLSDARNAGLDIAKGDFIGFVDSDDYVSEDFLEKLYDVVMKEKSDIVECDVLKVYEKENDVSFEDTCTLKSYDTEEALSLLIAEKQFHQHVWNKLYKAEFVLKIPFERGKLNEDEFWTYRIFGQAKKISKINKTMYFYLQRNGSIMGNAYDLRRLDALEAKAQRQKYIEKNFTALSAQAKTDFFGSCIFACQSAMKFLKGAEKKQAKKIIKGYVKNCRLSRNELSNLSGKIRFWFTFADKFFIICCKIRSITGVGF